MAQQLVAFELLASAARTASGNGTFSGQRLGRFRRALVLLDVSAAATEAGDTLDVYLQKDVGKPGSPVWTDFVHFTQVLGNGGAQKFVAEVSSEETPTSALHAVQDAALAAGVNHGPWSDDWRIKWVIVDVATLGNQSFTFALQALCQE